MDWHGVEVRVLAGRKDDLWTGMMVSKSAYWRVVKMIPGLARSATWSGQWKVARPCDPVLPDDSRAAIVVSFCCGCVFLRGC